MIIQDALKSGKPFKRKLWRDWHNVDEKSQWFVNLKTNYRVVLSAREVSAEDWEIKEEKEKPDLPFKISRRKKSDRTP